MKAIISFAVVGLALTSDIDTTQNKVGGAIEKVEQYLINHPELIPDGEKTFGDATSQHKNATALVDDGAALITDVINNNQLDINGVVDKVEQYLVNHPGLIPDGEKTFGDATNQHKNATALVDDGAALITDVINNNQLDINGVVDKVEQYLINHPGLIPDGEKTFGDATSQHKNATALVDDGAALITDLINNNQLNIQNSVQNTENYIDNHPELVQDGEKTFGDATSQQKDAGIFVGDGLGIFNDLVDNQLDVNGFIQKAEQYLINHPGLIPDGEKTFGDATSQHKNATALVDDGAALITDLINSNNQLDINGVVDKVEQYLINHPGLIPDGEKTFGDATSQHKNATALVDDGAALINDFIGGSGDKGFLAF